MRKRGERREKRESGREGERWRVSGGVLKGFLKEVRVGRERETEKSERERRKRGRQKERGKHE